MQFVLSSLAHLATGFLLFAHAALAFLLPHHAQTPQLVRAAPSVPVQAPAAAATTTQAAPAPIKTAAVKPAQLASSTAPSAEPQASVPAPVSSPALPPPLQPGVVNDMARAALVNILCTTKSGGYLYPISGSGVIVSDTGVILTNAHVGQYFLLHDYLTKDNVDCVIRTGSPAAAKYHARLLYLPPQWIDANASQIAAQEAMGTGENDYAFLLITSPTDPAASLPATFPSLALTLDSPARDESVIVAGYPAGFLGGAIIETGLTITSALTTIKEIYAFDDRGNPDLVSVGGTVVSQAGASGGAIVRQQDGALMGIVATASEGNSTSSRDLRGITLQHIERSLEDARLGSIVQLLSGNLSKRADSFDINIAPSERTQLEDALNKR